MADHKAYMQFALAEARAALDAGEVPIGAVAVHDGRIVGTGRNDVIARHDPSAHAEMLALRAAAAVLQNYRLNKLALYVTVEPCPMCIAAAVHARIEALYFGAPNDKWGYMTRFGMDLSLWNHRMKIFSGIGEAEASVLLKEFFRQKR